LTPVLVFLVLFGVSGWRPAPGSRRVRVPIRPEIGSIPPARAERRGPLFS
jgi:hypothetical protein